MPGEHEMSGAIEMSIGAYSYNGKFIKLVSCGLRLNGGLLWRNSLEQGNFSRAINQAAFAEARFHSIIFAVSLDEAEA